MFQLIWAQADTVFIKYDSDRFDEQLIYKRDTVLFNSVDDREVLYGTRVLPWTHGQQIAKGFGIQLQDVKSSDCNGAIEPTVNSVVAVVENDTALQIELKIFGNCCHSFLCDVEIVDESIINLKFYGYGGTYCACDCCYGLKYNFQKWDFENYKFLKSVMINDDKRTLTKMK